MPIEEVNVWQPERRITTIIMQTIEDGVEATIVISAITILSDQTVTIIGPIHPVGDLVAAEVICETVQYVMAST